MYLPVISELCTIIKIASKIVFILAIIASLIVDREASRTYFKKHKTQQRILALVIGVGVVSFYCDLLLK